MNARTPASAFRAPETLRQAAIDLHVAAYKFSQEARKAGGLIPVEDVRAVLHVTDEWVDLCSGTTT